MISYEPRSDLDWLREQLEPPIPEAKYIKEPKFFDVDMMAGEANPPWHPEWDAEIVTDYQRPKPRIRTRRVPRRWFKPFYIAWKKAKEVMGWH